jgi:hypothetical protein
MKVVLWIVLGIVSLLILIIVFDPAGTRNPKPRVYSIDQMISMCKDVSGQARRAAGYAAGEKSYDDCMAQLLREASEAKTK